MSFPQFRKMCVLAGCDYLKNAHGVGLRTAERIVRKVFVECDNLSENNGIRRLGIEMGRRNIKLPTNYLNNFVEAELTFTSQIYFDLDSGDLLPRAKDWQRTLDSRGKFDFCSINFIVLVTGEIFFFFKYVRAKLRLRFLFW